MKNLKISCVGFALAAVASVFAGSSALADTWFANSVQETLGTGWTVPTSSWTWKSTYGEFNNFETPLTFNATDAGAGAKSMPGDIATISTTVKFTAMDLADLETPAADVKGGLTVVETTDGDTVVNKYYGVVNGTWTELVGTPDLNNQVVVTITLSKNNDVTTITYTAGDTTLYTGSTTLGGSDVTIKQVDYLGRCELATLAGAAAKSVFDLSIPSVERATATVTTNGAPVVAVGGVYPITYGTGPIVISYASTDAAYMLVGDKEKTISTDLAGDTTLTAADFNNIDSKLIIAKIGDTPYESIQAAVTAAVAPATNITLVADSSDVVSIASKAVTFSGADDVVVGAVTIGADGFLEIQKGKYASLTLTPETNAELLLKGGLFAASVVTVLDLQAYCAPGYFANALVGDYAAAVVPGTIVVPPAESTVPVIAIDPLAMPDFPEKAEDQVAYLAEEEANGQARWVNYALGVNGTDSNNEPKLADAGDANTVLFDLANGAVKEGTGITATYKVSTDGGESYTEAVGIDLSAATTGTGKLRLELSSVDGKTNNVTEVTYGVKVATPASALEVISVPFTKLGSSEGLPLSQVLKLKNLTPGDKIYRYNATEGGNEEWTLSNEGAWVGSTDPVVKPGDGLWLERQNNTGDVYFFGGYSANAIKKTPVAGGNWGLVANPNLTESLSLAKITANDPNLEVTIDTANGPKVCAYNGTDWGYTTVSNEVRTIKGNQITIQRIYRETAGDIAPGKGFWVNNIGTEAAELNWNPGEK